MDSIMIIRINHIREGIHTDDCENTLCWDTVWNKDLKRNMDGDKGLWQCPQCNCVRDRDSADMISYEEYTERYL